MPGFNERVSTNEAERELCCYRVEPVDQFFENLRGERRWVHVQQIRAFETT